MMLRPRASILVGLSIFSLIGCVDPEGRFDEFAERLGETARDASVFDADLPDGQAGEAGACVVEPGFVEGTYLLTLSISVLPRSPIVASAELSTPPLEGGTGFELSARTLRADDRRTPVGDPINGGPFEVDGDGDFAASLPGLEVTGVANPISGSNIAADVVLDGNLCGDPSFFCGTVRGTASQPIELDLEGSTFTLVLLEAGEAPPERPPINCARELADPLP